MQNGSSLEASGNVGASETVTLAVDEETVGKLGEAAENVDELGCCVMTATNE